MSNTTRAALSAAEINLAGARVALIGAEIDHDDARAARLRGVIEQREKEVAHLKKRADIEGSMATKHTDNFNKALAEVREGVGPIIRDLAKLDAERIKYPADYYEQERGKLIKALHVLDANAQLALEFAAVEAAKDIARLRIESELGTDPTLRLANEMEIQRLSKSSMSTENFEAKAQDFLRAGFPERAKLLVEGAKEKGVRFNPRIAAAIEEALDEKDPLRAEAKAIEDEADIAISDFHAKRYAALVEAGLGVAENGQAGNGAPSEVKGANAYAKLYAFRTAQKRGETYVDTDPHAAAMHAAAEQKLAVGTGDRA